MGRGGLHVGRGILRISSDGDDRRVFWGLKFLIPGICFGKKIWQVFFRVYKTIWRFVITSYGMMNKQTQHLVSNVSIFHIISFSTFWKLLRPGNLAWDCFGVNFRRGDFLGFGFCPHSTIPVTWNSEHSPPPPPFGRRHHYSSLRYL